MKDLEFRVEQLKERPEALEALRQMLNHSSFFLKSVKNLTLLEEDPIFTAVEVDTLEKLINETQVLRYFSNYHSEFPRMFCLFLISPLFTFAKNKAKHFAVAQWL